MFLLSFIAKIGLEIYYEKIIQHIPDPDAVTSDDDEEETANSHPFPPELEFEEEDSSNKLDSS